MSEHSKRAISRRAILRNGVLTLAGGLVGTDALASLAALSGAADLKLGLVTDVHHADAPARGTRFYRESLGKLSEAVDAFRREKVDAVVELGDFIDTPTPASKEKELQFLREVGAVFGRAAKDTHFVLGNHCVNALSKPEFLGAIDRKRSYYSADHGDWHLVVLDACFRKDGVAYDSGNYEWTDTDIPAEERAWLKEDLAKTNRKTVVFAHQRLDREPGEVHTVRSCVEVRKLLAESGKVAAVFMGHTHKNELNVIDGIPYVTLHAMVEGSGADNSGYSVLTLFRDGSLKLSGFRQHAANPFARA